MVDMYSLGYKKTISCYYNSVPLVLMCDHILFMWGCYIEDMMYMATKVEQDV
jgi:hypothetical protein